MKIKYYKNFKEDNRPSMEQYSDQLINYQKENFKNFEVDFFRPKVDFISNFIKLKKWRLRYLRYYSYSNQIKKLSYHDIAHVCEQQYAQLIKCLNSRVKFITVHDLVPIVFENQLNKNPFLSKYSLKYLKFYNKVFAISQNTKNDILKYTDCPEDKIIIIKRSVENFFNDEPINKNEICRRFKIPANKKIILISGNIFYKNLKTSLKVLNELKKERNDFVFVHIGSNNQIDGDKIDNQILIKIPFLERRELPYIYKISSILFYPSIYEGFGMPLLEAMSCGIPIVCSDNSSIPEVVGDAGLKSNHNDVETFIKHINLILNNTDISNDLKKKSLERSKSFDNKNFQLNLIRIYKEELEKIN